MTSTSLLFIHRSVMRMEKTGESIVDTIGFTSTINKWAE